MYGIGLEESFSPGDGNGMDRVAIQLGVSTRPKASVTSASRWSWRISSPTRQGTRKNWNASSPAGMSVDNRKNDLPL
jgi:hypothetical protein